MSEIAKREETTPSPLFPFSGWDPFRLMRDMMRWDPFREIGSWPAWKPAAFTPRFDVKENPEGIVLTADLPGVKEDDLKVTLTGNRLSVSGKRESEEKKEGEHQYSMERSYGSFTRSFTLPEGIESSKVHAEMKDGVLTLMLPKRPEVKPKEIKIQVQK